MSKLIFMNLTKDNLFLTHNSRFVKSSRHFEACSAPICFGTIEQDGVDDVLWYPSELLCLKNDLPAPQKYVQRVQRKINKLVTKGKFKNVDRAFTFSMLSKIKNVTTATKGLNPERPLELKRFEPTSSNKSLGVVSHRLQAALAAPVPSVRSIYGLP